MMLQYESDTRQSPSKSFFLGACLGLVSGAVAVGLMFRKYLTKTLETARTEERHRAEVSFSEQRREAEAQRWDLDELQAENERLRWENRALREEQSAVIAQQRATIARLEKEQDARRRSL